VDDALEALGLRRRVVVTAPHFLVAPFVLQASDLVALLAERVARRFAETAALDIRPAPLPMPPWTLSLLRREDRAGEPALEWLVATVVSVSMALR
jgi:DNA-binding transcriptional LysR family regulator